MECFLEFYFPFILIQKLKDSGLGCNVGRTFAGAFAYTDDLALVSPYLTRCGKPVAVVDIDLHLGNRTYSNIFLPSVQTL